MIDRYFKIFCVRIRRIAEKVIAHGKLIAFDTPENLERQMLEGDEITESAPEAAAEAADSEESYQ